MIKVVFTYKTKTVDLPELMEKFVKSADPKFSSAVSNVKIERFKRSEGEFTFVILDIYYNSVDDYNERTKFERSQNEWKEIWFSPNVKHSTVSVETFEVI